ncbi:hypothetical protein CH299_04500 [Rhodococcus sp. 14-2686-1-2]|nr:hypothetical protein CH301_03955 [Rhodococcus sp. 15-1189-1-1a]OZF20334.1 hypothetical protein CH299_04500 [Rhodococcus sp. 14-2686-1-2]
MKRNHPHAPDTVTEDQVRRALDALGINAIGLFAVEIGRVEGTVRVERLVTDSEGRYVIEGTEYVTESHTLDVI